MEVRLPVDTSGNVLDSQTNSIEQREGKVTPQKESPWPRGQRDAGAGQKRWHQHKMNRSHRVSEDAVELLTNRSSHLLGKRQHSGKDADNGHQRATLIQFGFGVSVPCSHLT